MKEHWFYYLVKYTSWVFLKVFFGGVRLYSKENIPKDGAVIFAPNHQGAFMDAVLVGTYVNRPVSFLTRADVFNKWSRPILNALNMMPIYRIRDGINSLSQNDAVFETCFQLLAQKRAILIFPEGNHYADYALRPLSKGTSRLALDARDRVDSKIKVYIVPTGINYFSHTRPLAKAHIKFGEPIDLEKYMGLYREHKQKAYNALKSDLSEAMSKTMILAHNTEDYTTRKEWIFQPKHEGLYFDQLKEMAVSGIPEEVKPRKKNVIGRLLIDLLMIANLPPLFGLKKVISALKDKAFYVSIKYLLGALLHILWWSLLFALGVIFISWQAGLLFAATAFLLLFARQLLIKW